MEHSDYIDTVHMTLYDKQLKCKQIVSIVYQQWKPVTCFTQTTNFGSHYPRRFSIFTIHLNLFLLSLKSPVKQCICLKSYWTKTEPAHILIIQMIMFYLLKWICEMLSMKWENNLQCGFLTDQHRKKPGNKY